MKILTYSQKKIRILYAILVLFFLGACDGFAAETKEVGSKFDGENALYFIQKQMEFGHRTPGSLAHTMAGDWIIAQLQSHGWEVEEQTFSYRESQARNIIGKGGPSEGEWIILGAHYDTRPISDHDKDHPEAPVPGANDGGSGVAVLLELARVLKPEDLMSQIWLVFFDLEDSGGIDGMEWIAGSTFFAQHLGDFPDQVVIIDMVGDTDLQLFYEKNSDPGLLSEIWDIAASMGYTSFIPESKHSMLDDHIPFRQLGIPAIDIIDFDYPYWHTTQDTLDKVTAESLEQVGRTLQEWLRSKEPLAN